MSNKIVITGELVEGYRVASRPSKDYPYGTIEKQKPVFKELGLDLDKMYNGTLNVSISPHVFEMIRPEYTFENVMWTDLHPPETFSFSKCKIKFMGKDYKGWVYYPHPETKSRHFHNQSKIEILTEHIPEIKYGDVVEVELNAYEISIKNSDDAIS